MILRCRRRSDRNIDELVKSPRIIGVGVGIGIGVEKAADQGLIPIPIAAPTPRDIVILTFYGFINIDGIVKSQNPPLIVIPAEAGI